MRPAYLIALILALGLAYWSTGRADTALASWGLNKTDCVQVFGTTYCGKEAERFENRSSTLSSDDAAADEPTPDPAQQRVLDAWRKANKGG